MRPFALVAAVLLLCGCRPKPRGEPPIARAEEGARAPLRSLSPAPPAPPAPSLPVPPQQHEPWSPPKTTLPPRLVSAAATLFEQGLADPRGLAYHQVAIRAGSVWGDVSEVETRAWVLPASQGEARFAVSWSGLVYPVLRVGAAASVAADVKAALAADERERADEAKQRPDGRFYRFRHATPEQKSLAHDGLLPLRAVMLLRLGSTSLAEKVWAAWIAGMDERTNDDARHLADPYLMLASDWAWALFDRALCAHMRGDDRLAFSSAKALSGLSPRVEAEAERRGIARLGSPSAREPYLGFLEPLPSLLADQERRARRGPRAERAPEGQAERIAWLIDGLDEIAARQSGQPGGISLEDQPTVRALVSEGEAAVEPLIAALEGDERLTRSVRFHRDFGSHRQVLVVRRAVLEALSQILAIDLRWPSTADDLSSPAGREALARLVAQARAQHERSRGLPAQP